MPLIGIRFAVGYTSIYPNYHAPAALCTQLYPGTGLGGFIFFGICIENSELKLKETLPLPSTGLDSTMSVVF